MYSKDRCIDVKCKRLRRMLAMLRGGAAALRVLGDGIV